MIKFIQAVALPTALLFSLNIFAQQSSNPFTQQKGKRIQSAEKDKKESIIDGRLNKNNLPFVISNQPSSSHFPKGKNKILDENGKIIYLKKETFSANRRDDATFEKNPKEICYQFLKEISPELKIPEPEKSFKIVSTSIDDYQNSHLRLQQYYKNILIKGSEIIVHVDKQETSFNGNYQTLTHNLDTTCKIKEKNAIEIAIKDLKKVTKFKELSADEKQLLSYYYPEAKLIFLPQEGILSSLVLAWELTLRPNVLERWKYFVSAYNGKILQKINQTCSFGPAQALANDLKGIQRPIETFNVDTAFFLINTKKTMYDTASTIPTNPSGVIWTRDAANTDLQILREVESKDNTWSDGKAVSAHYNASYSYDYFANTHSRNSLDNKGANIISVINVTNNGVQMDNAYWNGKIMAYGNGSTHFHPLAISLDVAGHEMTHGVIESSANLDYQGQPGAINESMADIFGAMIDREDWKIGEDIIKSSAYPSGALRDMSDPHNGGTSKDYFWQPKHMSEYVSTLSDNGGVHINSGIPNHAFFLFASSVTKEKAEKVYYHALTHYLVASSKFVDLRVAVVQSSEDVFKDNLEVLAAAKSAFDQVGILEGAPTDSQKDIAMNTGEDYIIYQSLPNDVNTLYNLSAIGSTAISTTKLKSRPSITDDGNVAYFVNNLGQILRKELVTNKESLVDNSKEWNNVAISKDGLRLAAITSAEDSSIYIKSISGNTWQRYILYNPTFSGLKTTGPKYADAIEWDYSGETVMFDCFNNYKGANNTDIEYWDIGFLKAWNKEANDFGDGSIKKLFASLPSNVSIGNATFSKNSPYIIAFDFVDEQNGTAHVKGANIETGVYDDITTFNNGMLAFPSYSVDDSILAFTSYKINSNNTIDTVIRLVGLDGTKISYSSTYTPIAIASAKKPIWYAKGSRVLSVESKEATESISSVSFSPNPVTDFVNIFISSKDAAELNVEIYNTIGQKIKEVNRNIFSGENVIEIDMRDLPQDTYITKVKTKDNIETIKLVKVNQ